MVNRDSIQFSPYNYYQTFSHDMAIELKKTSIKRLQKPYDTQCQEYGDSNRVNCLNDCYRKLYIERFHCIPTKSKKFTIILNSIEKEENITFCHNNMSNPIFEFESSNSFSVCEKNCGEPCHEIIYKANIEKRDETELDSIYNFYYQDNFHRQIEFLAKLILMELLIRLFNIWNFWHGTSLVQLFNFFLNLWNKIPTCPFTSDAKRIISRLFNRKYMKIILCTIMAIFFFVKVASLTFEYLQFNTITSVSLVDYEIDKNYPRVSIIFGQEISYFPSDYVEFM